MRSSSRDDQLPVEFRCKPASARPPAPVSSSPSTLSTLLAGASLATRLSSHHGSLLELREPRRAALTHASFHSFRDAPSLIHSGVHRPSSLQLCTLSSRFTPTHSARLLIAMSKPVDVQSVKAWNETLREATASGATVIVDFHAEWWGDPVCATCHMVADALYSQVRTVQGEVRLRCGAAAAGPSQAPRGCCSYSLVGLLGGLDDILTDISLRPSRPSTRRSRPSTRTSSSFAWTWINRRRSHKSIRSVQCPLSSPSRLDRSPTR